MTHLPTGTGPTRRRLTLDEAQRGVQPEPFTRHEWAAMAEASAAETLAKHRRIIAEFLHLTPPVEMTL
jgi:hypothetical protein